MNGISNKCSHLKFCTENDNSCNTSVLSVVCCNFQLWCFCKNTAFAHFPKIHLIQILFSWSFAEPLERADGAPVTLGSTRWEPLYYSNWNYNNYSTFRFLNTWWQRLFISCHILTLYLLPNISEIFQNCFKLNE